MIGFTTVAHAVDADIKGRWISENPVFAIGEMTVKIAFDFKDSTTVMSNICYFPGRELEAKIEVPTTVEKGLLSVLGGGEVKVADKGFECNNAVEKGSSNYKIENGILTVFEAGASMRFVRR